MESKAIVKSFRLYAHEIAKVMHYAKKWGVTKSEALRRMIGVFK